MRGSKSSSLTMDRLKQRADFLAAAKGTRIPAAAFILQTRARGDAAPARFGFTVSKKVGNAVERNRVRRRLREVVRHAALSGSSGHDYVLVGRREALGRGFDVMTADLDAALRRIHRRGAKPPDER